MEAILESIIEDMGRIQNITFNRNPTADTSAKLSFASQLGIKTANYISLNRLVGALKIILHLTTTEQENRGWGVGREEKSTVRLVNLASCLTKVHSAGVLLY